MEIGFVSHDRKPYSESITAAGTLGFDYVELMMDGDARREVLSRDADEVATRLQENGVNALVHFPYPILIASPHEHQRRGAIQEIKRCIDTAVEIGASKGTVHPDSYGWRRVWDNSELHELLAESVRELHSYTTDSGFEICIENLYSHSFDVYEFDHLFDTTDASMTFDTGHAAIAGMDTDSMASFLSGHHDRISHLHLNETRHPDFGYEGNDEHLPLGYGSIDFERIVELLETFDWDGTMSIELDTAEFRYLRHSKEYLDTMLA